MLVLFLGADQFRGVYLSGQSTFSYQPAQGLLSINFEQVHGGSYRIKLLCSQQMKAPGSI